MTTTVQTSVWVLTREENEYDQHGEYFEAVFAALPTKTQLQKYVGMNELIDLDFLLAGGGRKEQESTWFFLRETYPIPRKEEPTTQEEAVVVFGFDPEIIGIRYRAWWIIDKIEEEELHGNAKVGYLAVRARDGGGNEIDVEALKLPNFVGTAESSFDCTYRYYYYRPLESEAHK